MSRSKYTILSQVLSILSRPSFQKLVVKHDTDKHVQTFDTWTHLVSMLFMHFAGVDSLRDISYGMQSVEGDLNHFGVKHAPSKSIISYQNEHRTHEVFQDYYFEMLAKLEPSLQRRKRYARQIKRKIYIMDSSLIPLCLSLFDWAKYRTSKGAFKLHAVLDYGTRLPKYATIGEGREHDIKAAKALSFPAESVLVMDRAYVDYEWLYQLDSKGVYFVTRLKSNAAIQIAESYLTDEKNEHILSDEDIALIQPASQIKYPDKLRLVRVWDEINEKPIHVLTNNFDWTADNVSQLYKARWDIEVFFKHLKQRFRVKSFVGTSPNAVRIQMWCALLTILLFRYLENKSTYPWHLSNLVAFLRINLLSKLKLEKWLNHPFKIRGKPPPQPTLFSLEGV